MQTTIVQKWLAKINRQPRLVYGMAVVSFLISIGLVFFDKTQEWRWLSFATYGWSIGLALSFKLKHVVQLMWSWLKKKRHGEGSILIVGVLVVAVLSRGWWLTSYPFISVGDEVREVGLYAQQIADGQRRQFFDYGAYQAYSLTISTVSALYYFVFGPSVLTYRLQAATMGVLDVVIVMAITWLVTKDKRMSGLAGLTLATLPLHLYYSRTEVVVMYSSTAAAVLYLTWVRWRNQFHQLQNIAVFATLLGVALGLYAAVRTVALMLLFLAIWKIGLTVTKHKKTLIEHVVSLGQKYLVLGLFLLVGFGPRLLYTTPAIFFHTSRLSMAQHTNQTIAEVSPLLQNYWRSLAVWFNQPTSSWYADHRPIVWPILGVSLMLGIGWAIRFRRNGILELLGIGLALHLTNSAITDMVNADHRLAPLYLLGALLIGVGLGWLVTIAPRKAERFLLITAIVLLLAHGSGFFVNLPANKNRSTADYLSMHTIRVLQQTGRRFSQVKITTSPENYAKLNTTHYKEQYSYFLHGAVMQATASTDLTDMEIVVDDMVDTTGGIHQASVITCTPLTCPVEQQPLMVFIR